MLLKEPTTPGDLFSGPMNIKWEEGAPAPVGYRDYTAIWLNGLVYVGGGNEGVNLQPLYIINCYDPVSNTWSSSINTPYTFFAMTTLNEKVVAAGGMDRKYMITNQILTLDAGELKNYTEMITARSHTTAAGHQGMLIITGGWDNMGRTLSSTELFDSSNGQWYKCDDLPQPHRELKPVIVDNILHVVGGYDKSGASTTIFTAPLDILSMHQLKWNTHQDTPWYACAPIGVSGTHLLIVGGYNSDTHTPGIYKLNKTSHSWEAVGHIPSARISSAAVSTADNKIIVMGGWDNGKIANTVWIGSCEPL